MLRSVFLAPIATCTVALALVLVAPIQAQQADDATPVVNSSNPADVGSIDAIMTALYDVISGPIGQDRDRARFLSLFAEGARLIPTGRNQETGEVGFRMMSPEEYWTNSSDLLKRIGFTEDEIGRTTETFGNITHAFSSYASYREDQGDPDTAFSRGINSVQLLNDDKRWWIVSVFWDSERPGNPIPSRYIGR